MPSAGGAGITAPTSAPTRAIRPCADAVWPISTGAANRAGSHEPRARNTGTALVDMAAGQRGGDRRRPEQQSMGGIGSARRRAAHADRQLQYRARLQHRSGVQLSRRCVRMAALPFHRLGARCLGVDDLAAAARRRPHLQPGAEPDSGRRARQSLGSADAGQGRRFSAGARLPPVPQRARRALRPVSRVQCGGQRTHCRGRAADPRQLPPASCRSTRNEAEPMNEVILANPRGFCAGVDRAIAIVEQALAKFGAPIYVRHEVVHNKFVVDDLKAKGAIFVDELADVPRGSTVVFSAHGVSRAVREEAAARGLAVFDATCPLVTKVHVEVAKMHANGREIVMIGHAGHPEVEGTMGQADGGIHLVESVADVDRLVVRDASQLAYVTQTTLSVDDAAAIVAALRRRFPAIIGPRKDDICYATQNRQDAVKFMAAQCDVVIVVGSPNSSNSNRLREVAAHRGIPAYMIDRAEELRPEWIDG